MNAHYNSSPLGSFVQQSDTNSQSKNSTKMFFKSLFSICSKPELEIQMIKPNTKPRSNTMKSEIIEIEKPRKLSGAEVYVEQLPNNNPEFNIVQYKDSQVLTQWIKLSLDKKYPTKDMSEAIIEHIKSIPLIKNSNNLCLITDDAILAKSFPTKFVWLVIQKNSKLQMQSEIKNNSIDICEEENPQEAVKISEYIDIIYNLRRLKNLSIMDAILIVPTLQKQEINEIHILEIVSETLKMIIDTPGDMMEKTVILLPSQIETIDPILNQIWQRQIAVDLSKSNSKMKISRNTINYINNNNNNNNNNNTKQQYKHQFKYLIKQSESIEQGDHSHYHKSQKGFEYLFIQALNFKNQTKLFQININRIYQNEIQSFENLTKLLCFLAEKIFFKSQLHKLTAEQKQTILEILSQSNIGEMLDCISQLKVKEISFQKLINNSDRYFYFQLLSDCNIIKTDNDLKKIQLILQDYEYQPIQYEIGNKLFKQSQTQQQQQQQYNKQPSRSKSIDDDDIFNYTEDANNVLCQSSPQYQFPIVQEESSE